MIWDELGLPRDNGSTDYEDSARLAGIVKVFDYVRVDMTKYYQFNQYVRHPYATKYSMSRDQTIPLMAGLYLQGRTDLVHLDFVNGKDVFTPSHRGHIRRCQGKKAFWYQDLWLWFDVIWSCKFDPDHESNQLLCMLMIHPDKKYLKYWLKNHPDFRKNIRYYWSGWRGEGELAEYMINKLEKFL